MSNLTVKYSVYSQRYLSLIIYGDITD